jgi:hypothetical protein
VVLVAGEVVMVTVDGQVGCAMLGGDELIQPGCKTFFDILREKLKWGER